MPYQSPTTKLNRWAMALFCCVLLMPIGLIAIFLVSMRLNWHNNIRSRLPAILEPGYFYRGDEGSPQGLVRYTISRNAARAIQAEGQSFLEHKAGAGWRRTPLPIREFTPFGDCGGFWCSGSDVAVEATRWVKRSGSFVLLSRESNNSLVIVVNPAKRALVFGYYID